MLYAGQSRPQVNSGINDFRHIRNDWIMEMLQENNTANSPFVLVLTLTWNQKDDTLHCLSSLLKMQYPNYSIVLIDNGSEDGTVEAVSNQYPEVIILQNKDNLGFPGGFNVGLRYALHEKCDYIFMINNDTEVASDLLDKLMRHAKQTKVGMLSPKIYFYDDPKRIWSVGAMRHPLTFEMTKKGDFEMDKGQWNEVLDRDYLVGCALLIKRVMLVEVGLFDEGYFPIYYEDMDLSLRAKMAGYRLLLVPQARMWHKVSAAAGGSGSPRERYLMARNSIRFFRKHVHGWRWLIVLPYRLGSGVKTVVKLLLLKRPESAAAYIRGILDGFRMPTKEEGTLWTS